MTKTPDKDDLSYLGAADRGVAWFARRPRMTVILTVVVLAGLGWVYLLIMVGVMVPDMDMGALGPGMGAFNVFNNFSGLDATARAALAAICAPTAGGYFGMPSAGPWDVADFFLVLVMWVMMVMAMMLPTAGPMLATYADIADSGRRTGNRAAPVVVLAAGYLSVWVAFAVVASLAQWGLTALQAMTPMMAPASLVLAGTTMIAAGIYQFTPAKYACLTRCQAPVPYFHAKWRGDTAGVFRLGVEQGLFCFGCCWALMAVMFAVGVMNVIWIAILGAAMALEKIVISIWIPRILGVVFFLWGCAVLLMSEPIRRAIGL
ncbi:putative metal-binding membrane protein [Rhodobium orientis]|nr:DUF2182 domain-containing protein [Rhodobium orientis]MBB4302278.1 putative metal-binding membrane protein [Rhodobium orientis]